MSSPSTRGRVLLWVKRPEGRKWSISDRDALGYFAAGVRTEEAARALVAELCTRWESKGYDWKVEPVYFEEINPAK